MHRLDFRARSAALVASILIVVAGAAPLARAVVGASGGGGPNTQTSYVITGGQNNGSVSISESVALNPPNGPWQKFITNNAIGRNSGEDVAITETLANIGPIPWTAWHEEVLTTTDFGGGNINKGFLFRNGSVVVSANYGSGFVPLTQGVDYTLTPTLFTGPPGSGGQTNAGNWAAFDIALSPARTISAGNTLRINTSIFEVFLDGDPWMQNEAAVVAQYPVPEPAAAVMCASLTVLPLLRRMRRSSP